jgi:hypothetical protein
MPVKGIKETEKVALGVLRAEIQTWLAPQLSDISQLLTQVEAAWMESTSAWMAWTSGWMAWIGESIRFRSRWRRAFAQCGARSKRESMRSESI